MTKYEDHIKDISTKASQVKADTPTAIPPPAIPPHIAGNLLEFLRRVESKGMEAIAWVEAYQFVQKHAPQQSPQPPAQPK